MTTEGGLDVVGNEAKVADAIKRLSLAGIKVSLFIDPDHEQINAADRVGAPLLRSTLVLMLTLKMKWLKKKSLCVYVMQ